MGNYQASDGSIGSGVQVNHPVAVAFAGRMGAGKSSISSALASDMKWKRASFGEFVRYIAKKRGLEQSREVLQAVGAELEAGDVVAFCQDVLRFAEWGGGESLVIDGIRHVRVLETLRKLIAPVPLLFVYLDAEEETRKSRLLARDRIDAASLAASESHSTEREVISRLPDLADLRLSNKDGSEQEMLRFIEDRLGSTL